MRKKLKEQKLKMYKAVMEDYTLYIKILREFKNGYIVEKWRLDDAQHSEIDYFPKDLFKLGCKKEIFKEIKGSVFKDIFVEAERILKD